MVTVSCACWRPAWWQHSVPNDTLPGCSSLCLVAPCPEAVARQSPAGACFWLRLVAPCLVAVSCFRGHPAWWQCPAPGASCLEAVSFAWWCPAQSGSYQRVASGACWSLAGACRSLAGALVYFCLAAPCPEAVACACRRPAWWRRPVPGGTLLGCNFACLVAPCPIAVNSDSPGVHVIHLHVHGGHLQCMCPPSLGGALFGGSILRLLALRLVEYPVPGGTMPCCSFLCLVAPCPLAAFIGHLKVRTLNCMGLIL